MMGIVAAVLGLSMILVPAGQVQLLELPKTSYGLADQEYQFLSGSLVTGGPAAPAVIFLDSGGWASGGARGAARSPLAAELSAAGFATLTVSHRTVEKYAWPAQIDDVRRAVQFVRFKAGEWNIDPERISINGRSSGGELALLAGHLPDCRNPQSADAVERQSSRLRCVVAGSAPADLALLAQKMLTPGLPEKPSEGEYLKRTLARLLAIAPEQVESEQGLQRLRGISPLYVVRRDGPPVFMQYQGPEDATSPDDPRLTWHNHTAVSGLLLAARLKDLGVPCELVLVADLGKAAAEIARRQAAFIKKHNGME